MMQKSGCNSRVEPEHGSVAAAAHNEHAVAGCWRGVPVTAVTFQTKKRGQNTCKCRQMHAQCCRRRQRPEAKRHRPLHGAAGQSEAREGAVEASDKHAARCIGDDVERQWHAALHHWHTAREVGGSQRDVGRDEPAAVVAAALLIPSLDYRTGFHLQKELATEVHASLAARRRPRSRRQR